MHLSAATLTGGELNIKINLYLCEMENICNAEKLHQAHSIVYSFLILLVCMIVYHFLGFGSIFVFPVWELICCVLVALSRNRVLKLQQQPVYRSG